MCTSLVGSEDSVPIRLILQSLWDGDLYIKIRPRSQKSNNLFIVLQVNHM